MLFLAELSKKKRQSLIEYITICNGIKFWEETLSDNHRNSKNPLTLWELPLALTTSAYRESSKRSVFSLASYLSYVFPIHKVCFNSHG